MRFKIIEQSLEDCPYLPGQVACLPLRFPIDRVTPEGFDALLVRGDRRAGPVLYRTRCPACTACEPLRVGVASFRPSRSQWRVWRKNEREVRVELGSPAVTPRHVELYNRHKLERGLSRGEPLDEQGYRLHLLESCVDTREVRYHVGDALVAVSILDFGSDSCSSVYHYFDPDESARSLGVFSVLAEIALCQKLGLRFYYLGLYVRDCKSLSYKASYRPHERLIDGNWIAVLDPRESRNR
jgi:arginine-tRNA-protein transferase